MERLGSAYRIGKRAAVLLACAVAAISLSSSATPESVGGEPTTNPLAAEILALITDDDAFAVADLSILFPVDPVGPPPTQHYGPFASGSPDSGTCGNEWAQDTFDRDFTIFNRAGSIVVVQQFKRGSFVTNPGFSPGACEGLVAPQGTVDGGVTGTLQGYFIIPIPPAVMQTSSDSSCVAGSPSAPCTTTGFINSHFTPACYPAGCPVTTFFFRYAAGDQALILHSWKNASGDRGGDGGDVRSHDL
jgi:hypothetical protein